MKSEINNRGMLITDLIAELRTGKLDKGGLPFVDSAERYFTELRGQDVVQEYLLESGECLELLEFIDFENKKSAAELTLAFKMLEQILLRIADDLGQYESTATYVVQSIMSSRTKIKSIYWMLSQGKSNPVKAALCLLTSMVTLGTQAAKEILSYFAFSHSAIKPLLSRTDVKSPQDIRSCYIQFILAFLVTDDNQIIRQVVDQKGLLNAIFHQLKNDKANTIQLFLSTLLSKVVQNASLPKTSKVRLLNDFSLKQVLELYCWKPPQGFKSKKHKSSKEDKEEVTLINVAQGENDELLEEQVEVREIAHQFLLAICCSRKQGILFQDSSIGTSGKNVNHLITSLLSAADKPHDSKYMRELVIRVLAASPDQLRFYLPTLQHSLDPRLSTRWISAMEFVQQIYEAQNPIHALKGLTETVPVNKLVTMVSIMTVPAIISQVLLTEALEHSTIIVRHVALKTISHTVKRVYKMILTSATDELVKINALSENDTSEFVSRLSRSINKVLPDWNVIKTCWTKAVSGLQDTQLGNTNTVAESEPADIAVLKGMEWNGNVAQSGKCNSGRKRQLNLSRLPDITLTEHLHLVLEVQLGLCQLLPDLKANLALDMPQLLDTLQKAAKMAETAEIDAFHVKMSQLVVKSEELRALLGTKELGEPLIHGLTHAICHSCDASVVKIAQSVLLTVLCEFGLTDYREELFVWIYSLCRDKSAEQYFNQVMHKFLENPKHFFKRVEDIQSRGNISCCMFSPLLTAAVEIFKEQSTCGGNLDFMFTLLKAVLHLHQDYKALIQLMSQMNYVFPKRLSRYYNVCTAEKKPSKRKRTSLDTNEVELEYILETVFEQRHQENLDADAEMIANLVSCLTADGLRICTHQCLFYLHISLSEELACKKEVVRLWCETLLAIVQREMDLSASQNENKEAAVAALEGVLPPVYSVVLHHPVLLKGFMESAKNSKIGRLMTRLILDIFVLVKKSLGLTSNLNQLMSLYYEQLKSILNTQLEKNQTEHHGMMKVDRGVLDLFRDKFTPAVVTSLLMKNTTETKIKCSNIYHFCLEMSVEFVVRSRIPYISGFWLAQNVADWLNDEATLSLILKLLEIYPMYATSIPCELVDHCFTLSVDSSSSILPDIVAIAISASPDHYQRFRKCCLTIEVTRQSLPLLLPMAAAFTESTFSLKQNNHNCTDEVLTVVANIFQIYFSFMLETFHDADSEINENVIQQFCRLLRLWVQMGNIDPDNIIKFLILKQDSSSWGITILRGGGKLMSVLKDFIPFVRKLSRLTHACFHVLSEAFLTRSWSRSSVLKDLIALCIACVKAVETSNVLKILHQKSAVTSWVDVAKQLLKRGLSEEDYMDCLELLSVTYSKFYSPDDNGLGLSVADVHNMIFGHSNFLNIMLANDKRDSEQKGKLLDLLLVTTSLDSTVCTTAHVAVILGSYGATLKPNDQKLLQLLSAYESHGCKVSEYRPYMWGPAAISHYAIKTKMGPTLHKESRMEDVLVLLDKVKLTLTAVKFPLDLELEPTCIQLANSEMYDPRFLLPLICHLLQPEVLVHCLRFLESGLLSVVFASLSSNCSSMRSAGYHALALFWEQLEGSRFSNKKTWIHLLECLKNAITEPNVKLFSMITAFLVRVSSLLLATDDPLYAPVCAFLIRKPVLDVQHIPEFLKLFNSSDLQYRKHRQWILELMTDGLKQAADFYLCEKAHAFKMILAYSTSSLCDGNSLLQVLELCCTAAKIPSKAMKLVQQHGILAYLHCLWFKRHSNHIKVITTSIALINILWKSISACHSADNNDDESTLELDKNSNDALIDNSRNKSSSFSDNHDIPFVFVAEFLVTLQALAEHLREIDINNWNLYLETLSSVASHQCIRKEFCKGNAQSLSVPHLTDKQVHTLLSLHTKIVATKSFVMDITADKEQDVTNVRSNRFVVNSHNHSIPESEVATHISDEHFLHFLLCWCEQRVQHWPDGIVSNEHHLQAKNCSPKTVRTKSPNVQNPVVCDVLQYVIQHLGQNSECSALHLQFLQCLELDMSNSESNCDSFYVFLHCSDSWKNVAFLFDIYNYCIKDVTSQQYEDKQKSHNRTLIMTTLNSVFLQLFGHVVSVPNSCNPTLTDCKSEFMMNQESLQTILTTKQLKESLTEMMKLQQTLSRLDDNKKDEAVVRITRFVANVILKLTPSQLPVKKKRQGSGLLVSPKRQKFVT